MNIAPNITARTNTDPVFVTALLRWESLAVISDRFS
jgi:hypothetical protein